MQHLVTILTFRNITESVVIKAKLESEGIETFIKNELTVQVNPMLSHAIGGIELQVKQEDLIRANTILNKSGHKIQDQDGRSNTEKKLNNFLASANSKLKGKPILYLILLITGLAIFRVCN